MVLEGVQHLQEHDFRRIAMLNEYPSVDALVSGVVGTTGFLSSLVSRKTGMIVMLIALGVVVAKVFLW